MTVFEINSGVAGFVVGILCLSEISFPDSLANGQEWLDFWGVERSYLNKYGAGAAHEMTGMWPFMKMILNAKEVSVRATTPPPSAAAAPQSG